MVEPEAPQVGIWWRAAYCTSKATRAQEHSSARAPALTHARKHKHALVNTHTEICKTYCFFTATLVS